MAANVAHAPLTEAALDRFVELNHVSRLLEDLGANGRAGGGRLSTIGFLRPGNP